MGFLRDTFILLALHFLLKTWQALALVTVTMRDDLEVFVGDTVQIPCQYSFSEEPSMVMIQWFVSEGSSGNRERIFYSDQYTQIADNGTDFAARISLSMGEDAGEDTGEDVGHVTLTLRNVRLGDEREFVCQVNGMSAGSAEAKTQLAVFDPPDPPVIEGTHSGISVNTEQLSMVASCEVRDGYPRPNISWYRDDVLLVSKTNVINVVTLVTRESSGLFTIQSNLLSKVVKEDKDASFHCRVSYPVPGGMKTADSDPVNITVFYPTTVVQVWKEHPKGLVKEGDTVVIRCRGDGNSPLLYSFSRKQDPDGNLDSKSDQLMLHNVSRDNSDTYQCNSLDLDTYKDVTGDMQLSVHYMDPVIVVPKDSEIVSRGDSLTATCSAPSSLETATVWLKDGRKVGEGSALVLQDVTYDMAGEYHCEVMAPSLPGLQSSGLVHIIIQGAPEVNDAYIPVDMEERFEMFVNLTCEAQGFPVPTITWAVSGTQSWREVLNRATENRVQSVVTVKVTSDITASCNATNQMGSEDKFFSIRAIPLVTSAAYIVTEGNGVIIVLIIVCILLMAILGSVLYFLYKKGKIPCGRSGKQDITTKKTSKGDIVVEMKSERNEEAVLLKGVNGDKKAPADQ